jgi:hypothetical protein
MYSADDSAVSNVVTAPEPSVNNLMVDGLVATVAGPVTTVNSSDRPSGRNRGKRWPTSPAAASSVDTGTASPPADETRCSGPLMFGPNTMLPSGPHVPPRPSGASHRVTGGPPASATSFSLPSAKNASDAPSGDQNGNAALSVPGSETLMVASRRRSQSWNLPSAVPATNAMCRLSGDTASWVACPVPAPHRPPNWRSSDGGIVNRTTLTRGGASVR